MTRIMRDSTNPNDIPVAGTQLAAGYANGSVSQWPANGWDRFPNAAKVVIDVLGVDAGADVLDVETGDATVSGAVNWVRQKRVLQPTMYPPIIYCNRSTLTPLFNAMNAAGFQIARDFRTWIATLDGTKSVADMRGVTAVQYAGESLTGGHYDESIVYDDNWKVVQPPTPPVIYTGILVKLPSGVTQVVTSYDGRNWK